MGKGNNAMRIGVRLILLLTLSVNILMLIATFFILRQLEVNLTAAAQGEIRAHANTLRLALEEACQSGNRDQAQRLIRRINENSNVYGAILFDAAGKIETSSVNLGASELPSTEIISKVATERRPQEITRQIHDQEMFSVIAPIQNGPSLAGMFEIVQPISFIDAELRQERWNIAVTAIALSLVIFLIVSVVLHFNLTRPVQALLKGAVAFGGGELSHRVEVSASGGELSRLAWEFNQMASKLDFQQKSLTREAEERLLLERQLRHTERLAAVGRLAAGVAHEVGAPLQVIDGRAKQLLEKADTPLESRQRNLTIIRNQAERITRLVRQMLNLSRPYELNRQNVSIHALLAEAVELVEMNAARSGVQIEVECHADHEASLDSDLLLQALANICQNAIQAMPDGGILRLECDEVTDEEGHWLGIRISDTGTGIPPEQLNHIFDPFFTTKDVGHGTGLGLAVSSRIVQEHGGRLEAANRPEGGAEFRVLLPRRD